MENPAIGKILGMVMAYGVSSMGLLLAYYNYRKRIVKAEQIFTPLAKAVIGLVAGVTVIGLIVGAAVLSGLELSNMESIKKYLPGMLFPAGVFAISYYLTWLLYKHFTGQSKAGDAENE